MRSDNSDTTSATTRAEDTLRPSAVAIVVGTRPGIIKLAPVVRHLADAAQIVHTGQHYTPRISAAIFTEYGPPEPAARLAIGGTPRGCQVGTAVNALDRLFRTGRPAAVIVQGDTNSTVAGAPAANVHTIPLVHVEAGLRSFDRRMPRNTTG